MPKRTTYTQARANLASICDEVAETREPYVIERRNAENVAACGYSARRYQKHFLALGMQSGYLPYQRRHNLQVKTLGSARKQTGSDLHHNTVAGCIANPLRGC